MVKLEKTVIIPLLTATVLGNKYKGAQTFVITQVLVGDFFNKGKEQVKLELTNQSDQFHLVLNKTNGDFLGSELEKIGLSRDSDNIEIGTKVSIESYDTGGTGTYQYGVKIVSVEFPPKQETLKTKPKSK